MKTFLIFTVFALFNFLISSFIHIKSFTSQANPYLSEEQRVEAGNMILDITIPAFAVTSIMFAMIAYYISKKIKK